LRNPIILFITLNLIVTSMFIIPVGAENVDSVEDLLLNEPVSFVFSEQEGNVSEPQPIHLHFYGGAGGELKADVPAGNSTTDVPCQGSNTARMTGTPVGTWTSPEVKIPITIDAAISCSIWAKSDQGANGVWFRVIISINGANTHTMETNSQSLSGIPSEFTGSDSGSSLELNQGDTISAQVIYFATPQYVIGPAPDSIMVVGGSEYDTHITITTAPITISVNEPIVAEDIVIFSATYADAFGSTKLNAMLNVIGKSDVITLSEPNFTPGANGSIVLWGWNYKTDKAQEGEYTVSVILSYGEDSGFVATGTYVLTFPKEEKEEGILESMGWLIPIIILVVIIVVAVIVIRKILARREISSSES
jgi:hypothetical protein